MAACCPGVFLPPEKLSPRLLNSLLILLMKKGIKVIEMKQKNQANSDWLSCIFADNLKANRFVS
jgi:hypothetical protein